VLLSYWTLPKELILTHLYFDLQLIMGARQPAYNLFKKWSHSAVPLQGKNSVFSFLEKEY